MRRLSLLVLGLGAVFVVVLLLDTNLHSTERTMVLTAYLSLAGIQLAILSRDNRGEGSS